MDWARPLYALPEPMTPAIREKATELTASRPTVEEKAIALLNFVQEEIRYLGIELGPKSHRPSPPDQVLSRRFGDCKDKTLLFCALARAAGIDAIPALTHSTHRQTMSAWLPSPDAFDHIIVRLETRDFSSTQEPTFDFLKDDVRLGSRARYFWLDPTIAQQGGDLAHRSVPEYGLGLPIAAGTTALREIARQPGALASITVSERYDLTRFEGPATLEVRSRYSGSLADVMRSYLKETPLDEVAKDLLNTRTRVYPAATSEGPPAWQDDPGANTVTVTHRYAVPGFWSKQEKTTTLQAEIYSLLLRDYTEPPTSLQRTAPLAVPYPVRVSYEAVLQLPHAWPAGRSRKEFEHAAFTASAEADTAGSTMRLAYSWQSRQDHVPAKDVPAYAEKLRRFREELGYVLTYDPEVARRNAHFRLDWSMTALTAASFAFSAGVFIWLIRRERKRPPAPPPLPGPLNGLGGWLVLVGLGVVVRPFMNLVHVGRDIAPLFDARTLEALASPGSESYNPGLKALVFAETALNAGLFVGGVFLAFLFFARSRLFPRVFVVLTLASLVFVVADTLASQAIVTPAQSMEAEYKEIGRLMLSCAIWIPYMCVSKRVRRTFVK